MNQREGFQHYLSACDRGEFRLSRNGKREPIDLLFERALAQGLPPEAERYRDQYDPPLESRPIARLIRLCSEMQREAGKTVGMADEKGAPPAQKRGALKHSGDVRRNAADRTWVLNCVAWLYEPDSCDPDISHRRRPDALRHKNKQAGQSCDGIDGFGKGFRGEARSPAARRRCGASA